MKELKSCPFCDNKAVIYEMSKGWYVDCNNDDCSHLPQQKEPVHVKENAVKQWNDRSSIPISKLEELIIKYTKRENGKDRPPYEQEAYGFAAYDLKELIDECNHD